MDVTKDANPTSVPETGGLVAFTVVVTNTSSEAVTLTALVDDIFGNLNGQGAAPDTCETGGSIPAGDSYTCVFTKTISGNVGDQHINTVTVEVADDDGSTATDTDDATVTFDNVAPGITITKTATPTNVPETGGDVEHAVLVTNDVDEELTLTALIDDVFDDLDGVGTCSVPATIPVDGSYSCLFTKSVAGNAGSSHTNTITATAEDDDGRKRRTPMTRRSRSTTSPRRSTCPRHRTRRACRKPVAMSSTR